MGTRAIDCGTTVAATAFVTDEGQVDWSKPWFSPTRTETLLSVCTGWFNRLTGFAPTRCTGIVMVCDSLRKNPASYQDLQNMFQE
jgi:hypothetical protein